MVSLMKNKRILAIVEGEKADFKLMNHLLSVFYNDDFYVWPYKTNLYSLYNKLKMNDDDDAFDNLDIKQVLKSVERDVDILKKLDERYTDTILIFDYDPQDPEFSEEKILKMKKVFSESTDNGKLYLNYPMVESFKHLKCIEDNEYENRVAYFKDLKEKKYKTIVNSDTFQTDFLKYDKETCISVFRSNLKKASKIIGSGYVCPINEEQYFKIDTDYILQQQNEMLLNEDKLYVLCTCFFFLLDNWPNYFLSMINEK
jgi:hypothetical protein|nr:MAG TPA: hypothetical protein [Caudoviricetes sp.]